MRIRRLMWVLIHSSEGMNCSSEALSSLLFSALFLAFADLQHHQGIIRMMP